MFLKKTIIFILLATLFLGLTGCSRKNNNDVILSNKQENDNISLADNEDGDILSEDNKDNKDNKDNEDNEDNKDNEDNEDNKDNEDNEDIEDIEDNKNTIEPITHENDIDDDVIAPVTDEIISIESPNRSDTKEANNSTENSNNAEEVNKKNDGNSDTQSNDKISESPDTDNNQNISNEVQKLSELGELSKKLALQMNEGEFKETHDNFAPIMKLQLTTDVLQEAWDESVADMGNYKNIREINEEISGAGTVVYVILDYDNSGIQVLFSYNTDKKLGGLWISFAPYDSVTYDGSFEEIKISLGDSKNLIEGVFTLPKNVKNPPVAILVHGSGNHDADESIGVNKPFRDLANGLARKGIAVIRYKENVPKSFDEFTIQDDSLDGAAHAIKYAQNCGKVDKDKIIIIGHSLGGMMAPKIAADNKEVDGIVSLAGSPRRLEDIILDQVSILNKADKSISDVVYKLALAQAKAQVKKVKDLKESSSESILGYPASYWYSLNQVDTPSLVKELDIPIFIAQGSEDFQVYADIDYVEWQEVLKDKDNVTFRLYDNLNHLFMTANGRMDTTEYNIKGTVEQKVIDDIAKWILKK